MNNQAIKGSKKKILIVEDEEYLRDLYVELLKEAGYQVDASADGEEGYEAMKTGGYDLVLLDIMLPKMDAFEILETLDKKGLPKKQNRQVVFLTNLSPGTKPGLKRFSKIKDYLIKSDLTPDLFLKKVKKYLS